jgi:hypothetical protein
MVVKYQFYEKPCSNKFVIPYHSAHSNKMKMSVIVEEGLRRMRNCSRGMDFEVRREVMERWSRKLQRSGYPATVRHQAIREAIDKFERICKVEDAGGRPIRRAREWQKSARRLDKEMNAVSWHKTEKGTVWVPPNYRPNSWGSYSRIEAYMQSIQRSHRESSESTSKGWSFSW